tara:strand:- start:201 stop:659 length:459 start_codon:yes stop_codon:yes gene_type:complete
MHYIIDAYNLIGKLSTISLRDKNKEDQLIDLFKVFKKYKNDHFFLIFDGKSKDNPYQSRQKFDQISVVFTDILESADTFILRKLKEIKHKSNVTVVTSDNEIKFNCRKQKINCINSESFFRFLSNKNKESIKDDPAINKHEIDFWLKRFNQS